MRLLLRIATTVGLSAGFLMPGGASAQTMTSPQGDLTKNVAARRIISPGEAHHWRLNITAGWFLAVDVQTFSIDVVVRLRDGAGALLQQSDEAGLTGVERVRYKTAHSGPLTLEVSPFDNAAAGDYQITWTIDRPPTVDDLALLRRDSLVRAGLDAFRRGGNEDLVRAMRLWSDAARLDRLAGDRAGESELLFRIGFLYRQLARPDSSLLFLHRALDLRSGAGSLDELANTLSAIGASHITAGHLDSAMAYYSRAVDVRRQLGDRRGEGAAINEIGVIHDIAGRPDSALAVFARALALRRVGGDRGGEAQTVANIGFVYGRIGRADSALSYLRASITLAREIGVRHEEAAALNHVGTVFQALGQPDSAIEYHLRARAILRELGDREGLAVVLLNLGNLADDFGTPESAVELFTEALAVGRELGAPRIESWALHGLGVVHGRAGRPDSAIFYLAQSLPLSRQIGDSAVHRTLSSIASLHVALKQPDSALSYYQQALLLSRASRDRASEASTLAAIGLVHLKAGDVPRAQTATSYYDSAAAVLSSIAGHTGGDQNRMSFAEQSVHIYGRWAAAWLSLENEIGANRSTLGALAAVERGRAQALLDLMRKSAGETALPARSAGADLAAEAEQVVRTLARTNSAAVSYLVTPDTLLAWLVLPGGHVQLFRTTVLEHTLSQQVALLRRGLGADSAAVRARLALRDSPDLEEARGGIGAAGIDASSRAAEAAARQLSDWLLPAELQAMLPDSGALVIVPHGALNLVPFAALPLASSAEPLGLRYAVGYSPSLAALAAAEQQSARSPEQVRESALVVGNPKMPSVRSYTGETVALGALAGAENEGRWVAQQVGATPLMGGAATESEIRTRLPSATLVHLATHGYAYSSEARARDSFVALAPTPEADGLLTVGEVLDDLPSLSAELVVLSACQTGLGDLKQAEGTVGLQRAFLAKGARSVLVSLWSVSDEATAMLMRSFYTHWLGGASKAEALRRAQAEVRATRGFEHARYWAAFQLVGAQ